MSTRNAESVKIITAWLADLSRLVRHNEAKPPPADQLRTYANMLEKDLPSGAFCPDSLHDIAAGLSWWPEYSALRGLCLDWWNAHKPAAAPVIDVPGVESLSREDQLWLQFYYKRLANETSPVKLDHLASLLRKMSPAAWQLLKGQSKPC